MTRTRWVVIVVPVPTMRNARRTSDVIRYWQAIEYFSPQTLQAPAKDNGVQAVSPGRPLPWTVRESTTHGRVWRHTVHLGVYDLSAVAGAVREGLGMQPDEDYAGTRSGTRDRSALACLTLDESGRYIEGTAALSSCAWAVRSAPRLKKKDQDWFAEFDEAQENLEQLVSGVGDALIDVTPKGGRRPTGNGRGRLAGVTSWTLAAVSGAVGAIPVTLVAAATPWISAALATLAEKVGGALADKATDTIAEEVASDDARAGAPMQLAAPVPLPGIGCHPFTHDDLTGLTEWLTDAIGVRSSLRPARIWIKSVQVPAGENTASSEVLKSFQADDLGRVATALRSKDAGPALLRYLTSDDELGRITRTDVRASPRIVLDRLAPQEMPAGCWPGEYQLVASQQFAVNQVFRDLAAPEGRGVLTVNGPPGTGKTTLLQDVVAGVVVERALRLAELPNARAAFATEPLTWTTAMGKTRTVFPPVPALTGYELVVASSNNGAVENVTRDLPRREAIDEERFPDADYLADQAGLATGQECWGAVAAVLGNTANRRRFTDAFHWTKRTEEDPRSGLNEWLQTPSPGSTPALSWPDAKTRFKRALSDVERLRDERQRAADCIAASGHPIVTAASLAQDVALAQRAHGDRDTRYEQARLAAAAAVERLQDADDQMRAATTMLESHQSVRPNWFWRAFAPSRNSTWALTRENLSTALHSAQSGQSKAFEARDRCDTTLRTAENARDDAGMALRTAARRARELGVMERAWPGTLPGAEWDGAPDDRAAMESREKSSPWMDAEFHTARSELFLAALDLHKALLVAARSTMLRNLTAAMDVLRGNVPANVPSSHVLAAWQTFFLVVPMVSTTFSSLPRMFGRIGREELGWLVVDEAGQAPMQHVAGAMWRARRALIVGDPLQLEPVVALDRDVQELLRSHLDVAETWMPGRGSAQSIADRINPFGTQLPAQDGDEAWVGMPLRVHRRCDNPMFAVSNAVAYDGMMVNGVAKKPPSPLLTNHTWIDVPAGESRWNELEGRWVDTMLGLIDKRGREEDGARWSLGENVFVVSPFKAVADQLRTRLTSTLPRDRVGTIHTTQGKEADVVILVLGGSVDDDGARAWAARTPNLLNVAVSRARRRIAVIGDFDRWSKHPHFSTLAQHVGDGYEQIKRVDGSRAPTW